MNLENIFQLISLIIRDRKLKISIVPEEGTLMLHRASLMHFRKRLGLPETYQHGIPVPKQGYAITEKIETDLSIFKVIMGAVGVSPLRFSQGKGYIPENVCYPSSLLHKYQQNGKQKFADVDIVTDIEWNRIVSNSLSFPENRNPIANIQHDSNGYYFRIMPNQIKTLEFSYLKYPTPPVYAYTKDNGFVEYDHANSTQLEWDDLNMMDIISYFLSDIGVSVNRMEIVQLNEKFKKEGI